MIRGVREPRFDFYFHGKRRHRPLHYAQLTPLLLLDRYDYRLTRSFSALINPETFSYSTTTKMQAAGSVQSSVPNTTHHIVVSPKTVIFMNGAVGASELLLIT